MERQKEMKQNSIPQSLNNSYRALISLLKTMYKGMPVLMVVFAALVVYLSTLLAINTTSMVCILSFVIVISSVCIYAKSKNYGEAVLALSAGLFTVYTVTWTLSFFLGFIIVWVLFTITVFLITSVRISSNIESIFLEASISLHNTAYTDKQMKKQLEEISNSLKDSILMPEERAETIRLFCFRKIEIDKMSIALKWVNIYYAITRLPYLDIATFVSDVIKNTSIFDSGASIDDVFDYIYTGMRDTPASPLEYIEAFKETRYILASTKSTILYFKTLGNFFYTGQPTSDIRDYVEKKVVID